MTERAGEPTAAIAARLREGLGLTTTASWVLANRGHHDLGQTRSFLEPRLADLTPPDAMLDRGPAADRLARAVRAGERIVVFGDYDVDGITSAAIMSSGLSALGGDVVTLLASRFDGGYGFSEQALARVLDVRPSVLVTCDCGSSDHVRIESARRAGIDVIVIDHHLVPAEPLPAFAFLNPHRPECGFPFKHLASCGLALTVIGAVRTVLGAQLDLRPFLDLVALGTVADVAPLVGDNRALVRAGLARMSTAPRPGLEALAQVAGVAAGSSIIGDDIAFRFAPRLNAPGRLGPPDRALALLLERDLARAKSLAAELERACDERKTIERAVTQQALAQVEATNQSTAPAIVVAGQGWHFGVVGIVAARLVDRFGVPAIVVALDGASGRGSVRGPSGSRLHDALHASRQTLVGFGGHQAAAGVHVETSRVEQLRERFSEAVAQHAASAAPAAARVADAVLDVDDEPHAVLVDFERIEPCGEGNPAPLLALPSVVVVESRVMKQEHLRVSIRHRGKRFEAFGFGLAHRAPPVGARVDLHGSLRRDTFRGFANVELRLSHLAPAENVSVKGHERSE